MRLRPPPALFWAFLAILAVSGLGAYFHFVSSAPLSIDEAWRTFTRLTPSSIPFTVAAFLAEIGATLGVAACGAVAAALLLAIHQRREAATILTALLLGGAMSQILKYLVERPRPIDALYAFQGFSYPSGHSMGAAALATSLALTAASLQRHQRAHVAVPTVRWIWVLAMFWVAAMMWSRTALGVHWLSDTLAGALLGFAAALIAHRLWHGSPASRAHRSRPPSPSPH